MSDKAKLRVFILVVAAATAVAFVQGASSEGAMKVVPLVIGFLGLASLAMWIYALYGSKRRRSLKPGPDPVTGQDDVVPSPDRLEP